MKTKKNKNGTVSITGMNREVYDAINWILCQVQGTIEFDEEMDCYKTINNGIITMREEDYNELGKIKWQI